MPKYWVKNYFAHGSFPEVGQKQKTEKILQGLGVGPGSATERWPCGKIARKSTFFRKKKITLNKYFFLDIPFSYAKILGENLFQSREFL